MGLQRITSIDRSIACPDCKGTWDSQNLRKINHNCDCPLVTTNLKKWAQIARTAQKLEMCIVDDREEYIAVPINRMPMPCISEYTFKASDGERHVTIYRAPKGDYSDNPRLYVYVGELKEIPPGYTESPIEDDFWRAYCFRPLPDLSGIIPQYPVSAGWNNYRLDFAIPDLLIAFEMDGKQHHSSEYDQLQDRERDYYLGMCGWQVHRFPGSIIWRDPFGVVQKAAEFAAERRDTLHATG